MTHDATIKERVLIVDDDDGTRQVLARILDREGYRCTVAADLAGARSWLERAPYDLLVCDVRLPDGSGLDLIATVLPQHETMAALMVSGVDDSTVAEGALGLGAYGYLVKPFSANQVLIAVVGALRYRRAGADARGQLRAAHEETIERLCIAMQARDANAAQQISEMTGYCWHIARELELSPEECDVVRLASAMHDVGNLAVPDSILLQPGILEPAERAVIQRHAETGYRILAGSHAAVLRVAATIAWTHHERFDGSGYPRQLAGDEIPMEGRIAAVADVFVALMVDRAYRPRWSREEALDLMEAAAGRLFDPAVIEAFLRVAARLGGQHAGPEVGICSTMRAEPDSSEPPEVALSARERQVLQLAADGYSGFQIAAALVVSPGTVKSHFQRIYGKLQTHDRAAAVATGLRHGLID